jgi:hypothetical protein
MSREPESLLRSREAFDVALGWCSSPGLTEACPGHGNTARFLSCPTLGKPIIRVGLLSFATIPHLRVPIHGHLLSGVPGQIPGYLIFPAFHGLRTSRYRGGDAFPNMRGAKDCTSHHLPSYQSFWLCPSSPSSVARFEGTNHTFPILAGTFHRHMSDCLSLQPIQQRE